MHVHIRVHAYTHVPLRKGLTSEAAAAAAAAAVGNVRIGGAGVGLMGMGAVATTPTSPWSEEEDAVLREAVLRFGIKVGGGCGYVWVCVATCVWRLRLVCIATCMYVKCGAVML